MYNDKNANSRIPDSHSDNPHAETPVRDEADTFHAHQDVSSVSWRSNPENCFEMINTYGTYEIQPTANSANEFPAISQGLPSKEVADIPDSFHEGIMPNLNKYGEDPDTESDNKVVQGHASD